MKFFLITAIGLVWFINGLACKALGLVPRHEAIVARILGESYAPELTILIGISEIFMALWVWSGLYRKLNTYAQIGLVITMNIIETIFARDLLLWSGWNLAWAISFVAIVYFNHKLTTKS